jgi:hypothetical protein
VTQSNTVRRMIKLICLAYFDEPKVGDGVLIDPETWEVSIIEGGFIVETLDDRYIMRISPEAYAILRDLR